MAMFTKRTSKPNAKNLEFVTTARGGWSRCIQGSPTDAACDVLSNCVGYACGRFNEIYNEIMKTSGMKYPYLNCNAENFIERAKQYYPDITYSNNPKPGSIMCWRKGEAGKSSDGAGHVAIVEEVVDNDTVITSESAYSGAAWYSKTRTRGDGNWGMSGTYVFRAFMLNPAVDGNIVDPVERDTSVDQIKVFSNVLRVRETPSLSGKVLGFCAQGYFDVLAKKKYDGYTWYQIGDAAWVAGVDDAVEYLQAETTDKLKKQIEDLKAKNANLQGKLDEIKEIVNRK